MAKVVQWWLGLWYLIMGYYAVSCVVFPVRSLVSFTGQEEKVFGYGEIELTKRLGIVYTLATLMGLYITMCGNMTTLKCACIMNAVYSLSLCILISGGELFWDNAGVIKNVPFVFINLIFGLM